MAGNFVIAFILPDRIGAASGLVLGFSFASGAIGNLFSGLIADWWDLPRLFIVLVVMTGIASVLAHTLKGRST